MVVVHRYEHIIYYYLVVEGKRAARGTSVDEIIAILLYELIIDILVCLWHQLIEILEKQLGVLK